MNDRTNCLGCGTSCLDHNCKGCNAGYVLDHSVPGLSGQVMEALALRIDLHTSPTEHIQGPKQDPGRPYRKDRNNRETSFFIRYMFLGRLSRF